VPGAGAPRGGPAGEGPPHGGAGPAGRGSADPGRGGAVRRTFRRTR
jgi:hypothetical protein